MIKQNDELIVNLNGILSDIKSKVQPNLGWAVRNVDGVVDAVKLRQVKNTADKKVIRILGAAFKRHTVGHDIQERLANSRFQFVGARGDLWADVVESIRLLDGEIDSRFYE